MFLHYHWGVGFSGIYNDTKNSVNSQGNWGKADIDKHYQVLGCTKDNSDKEIKKAYRKAISKHHLPLKRNHILYRYRWHQQQLELILDR
jgi:DnaJ-domain-containing protein 1